MSGRSAGKDIGVPNFNKMEKNYTIIGIRGERWKIRYRKKYLEKANISELNDFHPIP
jgi:hypothetical protein